ncbi:MAG: C40 family peptidase [Candidatus Krumholzibacteriia bacterium]
MPPALPPSRPSGLRRRFLATAVLVLPAFVALVAGCAPKRVVQGETVRAAPAPAPRPLAPSAAPAASLPAAGVRELGLPDPEPRGLAGAQRPVREPAGPTLGLEAADLVRRQLGKPYQWGASGPDRFDCSGLVQHVYGELGIDLPRVSRQQASRGRSVRLGELRAGDLLFFAINGGDIDHVGIYVGQRNFIHAPRRYLPVSTESLDNAWWRQRYRLARRLP